MVFDIIVTRTDKSEPPLVRQGGTTLYDSMLELGKIITAVCQIYAVHGQVLVEETEDELSVSRYIGWKKGGVFTPFMMVTLKERA